MMLSNLRDGVSGEKQRDGSIAGISHRDGRESSDKSSEIEIVAAGIHAA
jgi:hypothetical protein